jgi:hypothetical protein
MKRHTPSFALVFGLARILAVAGGLPIDFATAQTISPAPSPGAVPPDAAPASTAAHETPIAKGRGRKTVGQGMNAQAEAGEPRADTSPSAATVPGTAAAAPKTPKPADRVDLDTTTVTGNRELPKVMYVVPWKKSDIGDLGGKPMNSLLDEVLAPVDRDVFRREVVYYQAVKTQAPQNGAGDSAAPPGGAKQVEK